MTDVRAVLGATEIFSGLSEEVLGLLAGAASRRELPAGTLLWAQGTPRQALFVILEGSIEISRERDGVVEPLSVEGRGEAVGVGALLHTSDHTTSARALTRAVGPRAAAGGGPGSGSSATRRPRWRSSRASPSS